MKILFVIFSTFALHVSADLASVPIEDTPHTVVIYGAPHQKCTGSIISDHWVITTYTCVFYYQPEQFKVRAGTANMHGKDGNVHQVDRIVGHESFRYSPKNPYTNDIALVHVVQPFDVNKTHGAIPLFSETDKLSAGPTVTVSGFGLAKANHYPTTLQTTEATIVDLNECNKTFEDVGGIPKGLICARYKDSSVKNSCYGDAGGALTVDKRLAGVTSWSLNCGASWKPGYPVLYTDISYYRGWIDKHVKL